MYKKVDLNNDLFLDLINDKSPVAFQMLFKLYRSKLLFFATNYISCKEDAEEIIQDVFVKIWKNNISYTNFNAYIYKVTRNACLDHLRKKKLTLSIEDNLSQIEAAINYNALKDDITSSLIEKELEKAVLGAIEHLPKKCKNVFILSRMDGLKHKEISKELNISTKTVENHIGKALRFMRLHLREFLTFL